MIFYNDVLYIKTAFKEMTKLVVLSLIDALPSIQKA